MSLVTQELVPPFRVGVGAQRPSPAMVGRGNHRQLHPVCAFVYPSSTLRIINKHTDGQACSMLKEDIRAPISLGPCPLLLTRSLKMSVIMHNTLAKIYMKLRYFKSKGNICIWCTSVYVHSIERS